MERSSKKKKTLDLDLILASAEGDASSQKNDFLSTLKASQKKNEKKTALHKWGAEFDNQKFEPLPRVLLENMDVFQFRGSELAILIQILMWWSEGSRWPTCYYDSIASRTGLSNRIVMDNLKKLEEKVIKVPKIEFGVDKKKRGYVTYNQVPWKSKGLLKRLKYSELPEGMLGRGTKGARYFDLSNLIDICKYLMKQHELAKEATEQINKARQTKSAEELIEDIISSKDYQEVTKYLRKYQ